MIEQPTKNQKGAIRVRIMPNCGMETAGCSVELQIFYVDFDSTEVCYELQPESAIGLTNEQLDSLQIAIC